ncbi:MAG: isochorismatase hydrolase [Devosia sp.]|uniref:isochorismatase family protein n=1 Tax=Devosia sp. TaxID=1871048 RepID=UPI00260F5CDF|nr:isochorismatase family protein [Devosia sp.]MDB5527062.1 isochorismatase hydrolase [Devosia sp.]
MSLTTLDPKTALVVLDLQEAIRAFAPGDATSAVFKAAGTLTAAFRKHNLPVILVNVSGTAPGRTETPRGVSGGFPPEAMTFVTELGQQPSDIVVTKTSWGAFPTTDIEQKLRNLGVTQVVLAGISTTSAVESTARQAYEAGFNVTLALDAMLDTNPEAHAAAVKFTFPRLGETGSSADIIALLDQNR